MKKEDKKEIFILYEYNDFKNDFQLIKEYLKKEELKKDFSSTLKNKYSINHYIKNNINNKITNLLNKKYIIIKEYITQSEYQDLLY